MHESVLRYNFAFVSTCHTLPFEYGNVFVHVIALHEHLFINCMSPVQHGPIWFTMIKLKTPVSLKLSVHTEADNYFSPT